MKHGDKAKKPAKAQASSKKTSAKVATKSKAGAAIQGRAVAREAPVVKTASRPAPGGNGKGARNGPLVISFTNPVVGAAFKRAVKKYPTAFRRLTD